jgi:hypothetical protein
MRKPRIRIREVYRALLGCVLLSALAGSAAWGQTPSQDMKRSLEIAFPHDFSCSTFFSPSIYGEIFWRLCESKQDDVIATMQTGLFPEDSIDTDPALAKAVAQQMVDAATFRLVDGKWDKLQWVDLQGGKGLAAVGHRLDGRVHRLLSITKERRIFYITGIAPEGRPEIEKFFNSVRLSD